MWPLVHHACHCASVVSSIVFRAGVELGLSTLQRVTEAAGGDVRVRSRCLPLHDIHGHAVAGASRVRCAPSSIMLHGAHGSRISGRFDMTAL